MANPNPSYNYLEVLDNLKTLNVLLDVEDRKKFSKLNRKISLNSRGYPKFYLKNSCYLLSRWVMGFPDGKSIDHINHNPLDNRKINLRSVSHAVNMANRKHKDVGVYFSKDKNKWAGCIRFKGKRYRKHFDTKQKAQQFRIDKEIELHGKEINLRPL